MMNQTTKLGPEGFNKIAILGSAPSSILLAPFNEPGWAIWATSPSAFAQLQGRHVDVWFELHRFLPYEPGNNMAPGTRPWFSPEFRQYLREFRGGTVFMTEKHLDISKCVQFPYKELLDKHGPYHFCSSVAWMLALALEQPIQQLGLFGIDMAAGEEWSYQRPSCQHFLGMAKQMGIDIVLPPESDLMRHTTLYGIGEHNPRHIRLSERLKELTGQEQHWAQVMQQAQLEHAKAVAAKGALQYVLDCWSDDVVGSLESAISFSGCFRKTIPAKEVGGE